MNSIIFTLVSIKDNSKELFINFAKERIFGFRSFWTRIILRREISTSKTENMRGADIWFALIYLVFISSSKRVFSLPWARKIKNGLVLSSAQIKWLLVIPVTPCVSSTRFSRVSIFEIIRQYMLQNFYQEISINSKSRILILRKVREMSNPLQHR